MTKKEALEIFIVLIIFWLIGKYIKYSVILIGLAFISLFIYGIIKLWKKPIPEIFRKVKTKLIRVEDFYSPDENFNMILILKDEETGKEYKEYIFRFNKPDIGTIFYVNVNVVDERSYEVLNNYSGENINTNPILIGALILCIGFTVFLLVQHFKTNF